MLIQVPSGVLPKNETKYEEMMDILQHLQGYVPAIDVKREMKVPGSDEPITIDDQRFTTTLMGGDQLTVACARGAQLIRSNTGTNQGSFAGLLPVVEDWHTKLCLMQVYYSYSIPLELCTSSMQVLWKRLYNTGSGMQRGTLYQLRNAINRRNVSGSCKTNVNACEDFFQLVVSGHILVAVMSDLGMSSVDDTPSPSMVPADAWMLSDEDRSSLLIGIARKVVDKYVDLSIQYSSNAKSDADDTVYSYACETLSLGLLYLEFEDGINEGDGDRVLRVWKFLLLPSKRKNYVIEAFTLLVQYYITLPPRLAEQLKWSRFINVHGLPGRNISCDLHIEHLNRLTKTSIAGLGANKSEKAIIRTGKTVGALSSTIENLDKELHVPTTSGSHSTRSSTKDLKEIVSILQKQQVFQKIQGRKHKSFKNLKTNLIKTIDEHNLKEWMTEHFATMVVK